MGYLAKSTAIWAVKYGRGYEPPVYVAANSVDEAVKYAFLATGRDGSTISRIERGEHVLWIVTSDAPDVAAEDGP